MKLYGSIERGAELLDELGVPDRIPPSYERAIIIRERRGRPVSLECEAVTLDDQIVCRWQRRHAVDKCALRVIDLTRDEEVADDGEIRGRPPAVRGIDGPRLGQRTHFAREDQRPGRAAKVQRFYAHPVP